MRTSGNFNADTSHQGGWIIYDAMEIQGSVMLAGAANSNLALTRTALGNYSLNRTAAGAEVYQAVQNILNVKRLIEVSTSPMPFNEQFGTAAGLAGYPAGPAGMPPYTGASQLTPPTGPPAKGLQITDVVAIYQVGVVDLTSASLSLNRTVWANNTAPVITNLPISATALPLTAAGDATGPYVATRAVTTPVFETTDLSDLSLEFAFTMANTGTMKLFGIGFHCNFNYN